MALVLLKDEILVADINHHAALVESKIHRARFVAVRAVDDIVPVGVNGGLELLADNSDKIFPDVRQRGPRVDERRHGEVVARRVSDGSLSGFRNPHGRDVDPVLNPAGVLLRDGRPDRHGFERTSEFPAVHPAKDDLAEVIPVATETDAEYRCGNEFLRHH